MTKISKAKSAIKQPGKKQVSKKKKNPVAFKKINAKQFIEQLKKLQSAEELIKIQHYFKSGKGEYAEGDQFMGLTWV